MPFVDMTIYRCVKIYFQNDFFELGKATMRLLEKKLQGQNDSNGHVSLIPVTINKRTSTLGKVMSAVTV